MNPMQIAKNTFIPLTVAFATLVSCADGGAPREGDIKTIEGVGDFRQGAEGEWVGLTTFDEATVSVELRHYDSSFTQISDFAKEVFGASGWDTKKLRAIVARDLGRLQWKFDKFDPAPEFSADDFRARNFYLHWNTDNQKYGAIILLDHNTDKGRWVIDSYNIGSGTLSWTPKE